MLLTSNTDHYVPLCMRIIHFLYYCVSLCIVLHCALLLTANKFLGRSSFWCVELHIEYPLIFKETPKKEINVCQSCVVALTPKGLTVPINQIGQYNVCFLSRMPVTEGMVVESSFGPTKVSQLAGVVSGLSLPGGLKA